MTATASGRRAALVSLAAALVAATTAPRLPARADDPLDAFIERIRAKFATVDPRLLAEHGALAAFEGVIDLYVQAAVREQQERGG